MRMTHLEITLIDDVVLSAHSATVGAHESLSYIPGATLLGVAARKLYRTLNLDDSFTAFHSGKIRFCNGLPMIGEMRTSPMPLAFHLGKSDLQKAMQLGNGVNASTQLDAYNLARLNTPENIQLKAIREGYIDTSGKRISPLKTYRMKTAINAVERRAAEGQLFGYQALAARQRFGAMIAADDSIDDFLFKRVTESVCGLISIGRSRSAEYGRVYIELRKPFNVFPIRYDTSTLVLLAISDLALVNHAGQPTLTPSGQAFGLSGARVDFAKSFIRTRSYSPYNAKRCAHDVERHVITQGSVITLNGHFSDSEITQLDSGVGIHREAGLGEVLVNPEFLAEKRVSISYVAAVEGVTEKSIPTGTKASKQCEAFITWLRGRVVGTDTELAAGFVVAKTWCRLLADHQVSARRYLGTPAGGFIGPSASQWGVVYHLSKNASDFVQLRKKLRDTIKESAEGWQEKFTDDKAVSTFHSWFLANIDALDTLNLGDLSTPQSNRRNIAAIREFAKLAMDDAQQWRSASRPSQREL